MASREKVRQRSEQIRALNARGLTDTQIASRVGLCRSLVSRTCRRLGLPTNDGAITEAKRRAAKAQRKTLGLKDGGELRAMGYRNYARENGWPEDLAPREVQILNVLAARGVPMTRPELSAAIGMGVHERWKSGKRRILLSGNTPGGTYTASLARRGLIAVLPRMGTVTGRGKGRSRDLYYLGPEALKILEARACQERTASIASPSTTRAS